MCLKVNSTPPIMSLQKCPFTQSHKKWSSDFFIVLGIFSFTLLRLNSDFTMPKHSFPTKKTVWMTSFKKKKRVIGEKKKSAKKKKSHFCNSLCCLIRLSSESTTVCVYSFNLYYVNEPVKCLESCDSAGGHSCTACAPLLGER